MGDWAEERASLIMDRDLDRRGLDKSWNNAMRADIATALREAETREREHAASLVDAMLAGKRWDNNPGARMALTIASRAIRRGRHLTKEEQMENIQSALEDNGNE